MKNWKEVTKNEVKECSVCLVGIENGERRRLSSAVKGMLSMAGPGGIEWLRKELLLAADRDEFELAESHILNLRGQDI